jgi:hypothetical protein
MHLFHSIFKSPPVVSNVRFHLVRVPNMYLEATHNIVGHRLNYGLEPSFFACYGKGYARATGDALPNPFGKESEGGSHCSCNLSGRTKIGVLENLVMDFQRGLHKHFNVLRA